MRREETPGGIYTLLLIDPPAFLAIAASPAEVEGALPYITMINRD
jgi:hypothetical protein